MKKVVGIVLSLVGLAVIGLTTFDELGKKYLSFLPSFIQSKYVMIAGLMFVILGVILSLDKGRKRGKIKQAAEEVPIYAGEGKHRKIVGYNKG